MASLIFDIGNSSVVGDDCNMLTAFDLDIDMLKQGKRAKVFGEIFNRKHIISADDLRQSIAEATREMKEHYQLTVDYDMSPEIPRNVKYCFIAAVKEAMSNIAKHSDADKISVILREHPAFYQLTVEDNGMVGRKGQNGPLWEEEVVRMDGKEGIGLFNMKERVQALGGTFRIHTEKGFVIFISIPKKDNM